MNDQTRKAFALLVKEFRFQVIDLGEQDFPQSWIDGFFNVVARGESASDYDNPYEPEYEQTSYSNYKKGSQAAEILLKCPPRDGFITKDILV